MKKKLPFSLTNSQEKCIAEIQSDLSRDERMYRLIQGDVGSGKTLVAFFSMLFVAENSGQAVLMVPTDILAKQHYKLAKEVFNGTKIKIKLLTGKTEVKTRKTILEDLKLGKVDLLIGTHALFQKKIDFIIEKKESTKQLVNKASQFANERYDYDKHFVKFEELIMGSEK